MHVKGLILHLQQSKHCRQIYETDFIKLAHTPAFTQTESLLIPVRLCYASTAHGKSHITISHIHIRSAQWAELQLYEGTGKIEPTAQFYLKQITENGRSHVCAATCRSSTIFFSAGPGTCYQSQPVQPGRHKVYFHPTTKESCLPP